MPRILKQPCPSSHPYLRFMPRLMKDTKDPHLRGGQSVVDVVGITSEDQLARTSGPERPAEKRVSAQLFGALYDVLDDLECSLRVLSREI